MAQHVINKKSTSSQARCRGRPPAPSEPCEQVPTNYLCTIFAETLSSILDLLESTCMFYRPYAFNHFFLCNLYRIISCCTGQYFCPG